MPLNFSNYVFRPPALNYGGIADGLDTIIEGKRERARQAQQESQYARTRSDDQSQFSANFAKQRSDDQYTKDLQRFQTQQKLIADARAAAQAGHWGEADALAPSIQEFGGTATRGEDANGYPIWDFKEGAAPTRPALDFYGARRDVYGPSGPSASTPFQVPGFGPNGQRNPMDPHALPGASAAMLPPPVQTGAHGSTPPPPGNALAAPPPDAAGPPPGKATEGYPGREGMVPPEGVVVPPTAPQQAAQPDSEQFIGPNPLETPAFSPYRISAADVMARSRMRLDPYLEGVIAAAPSGLRERLGSYTQNIGDLGLDPSEAIKLTQPMTNELFAGNRADIMARAQAGRADNSLDQRREDRAWQESKDIVNNEDLKATKKRLYSSKAAYALLDTAHNNPQSARDLIKLLYRMRDTGVMTDKDFEYAQGGLRSLWGMVKDNTLNKFFSGRGGLNPTQIAEIKELLDVGTQDLRDTMMEARDRLYAGYKESTTDGQRMGWKRAIKTFFGPEYWPEEFGEGAAASRVPSEAEFRSQNPGVTVEGEEGGTPDTSYDPTSGPPQLDMPPERSLGTRPIPSTIDGRRSFAGPQARNPKIPPKPPRGRKRTKEEVDAIMKEAEEQLDRDDAANR